MKTLGFIAFGFAAVVGGPVRQACAQTPTAPWREYLPASRPTSATQPTTASQPTAAGGDEVLQECRRIAAMVKLTDQQWKQVEQNLDRINRVRAEWENAKEPQVQVLAAGVAEARMAKDTVKIRQLEAQLAPLLAERGKVYGNETDAIMSVLTEQQVAEYEAWGLYATAIRMCEEAGITEEQKPKVMELCRQYALLRLKAQTWRQKSDVREQLLDAVLNKVLTEEQRITGEAFGLNQSATWYFNKAGLTEQQKRQIYKLCREIGAERLKAKNWREEAYFRRVMLNKVYSEVLTDQQQAKVARPQPPSELQTMPATGPESRPDGEALPQPPVRAGASSRPETMPQSSGQAAKPS